MKRFKQKIDYIKTAKENGEAIDPEMYRKESSKPLFIKHDIIAFTNGYNYSLCTEIFKLINSEQPNVIYDKLKMSNRNHKTLLILQDIPRQSFTYRGALAWNTVAKSIMKGKKIDDISIETLKTSLKKSIYKLQSENDPNEWTHLNTLFNNIALAKDE